MVWSSILGRLWFSGEKSGRFVGKEECLSGRPAIKDADDLAVWQVDEMSRRQIPLDEIGGSTWWGKLRVGMSATGRIASRTRTFGPSLRLSLPLD